MTDCFIYLISWFNPADIINEFLHADAATVYWLVFAFMVIESSFIPFPSEVIVPPAAYLSATSHEVNVWLVLLLATCGAIVGALVNYYLSMWIGRPIVYKFAQSGLGHALFITPQKVENAEKYFDKHGAVSTFVGRLIPAIRQLISIPAGLSKMNIGMFIIFTALGAAVWNGILAGLGCWLGTVVTPEMLYEKVEEYNTYLSYGGILLGVVCVGIIIYNAIKKSKENNHG